MRIVRACLRVPVVERGSSAQDLITVRGACEGGPGEGLSLRSGSDCRRGG